MEKYVTIESEAVVDDAPQVDLDTSLPLVNGKDFKYEDFTPEQIAELQKPAKDAAKVVNEAESLRVKSENDRVQNESERKEAEASRNIAEQSRATSESERISAEQERQEAEQKRVDLYETVDSKIADCVKFTPQSRSEEEKAIARGNIGAVKTEAGKGLSANDFTDTLKAKLEATMPAGEIRDLIAIVQGELDTLVGGDTSSAIDTFNEIKAFLASFTDSDDLASILLALKNEIVALIPSVPAWALESTKPTYTASEVGALPDTTVLIPEPPQDGKRYVRCNNEWVVADTEMSIFIKRWNYLCGVYGRYNEETGYFELNNDPELDNTENEPAYNIELRTLSYDDAYTIVERANWINGDLFGIGNAGKTNIPQRNGLNVVSPHVAYTACFMHNQALQVVNSTNIIKMGIFVAFNCTNLAIIKGPLDTSMVSMLDTNHRIHNCPKLQYFSLYGTPTKTVCLQTLKSLTRECIMYNFVSRKTSTAELIVNIEQEAYDRLTEDDLAEATEKNVTFAIY